MLRVHEQTHGHHVVILVLVVGAGNISKYRMALFSFSSIYDKDQKGL